MALRLTRLLLNPEPNRAAKAEPFQLRLGSRIVGVKRGLGIGIDDGGGGREAEGSIARLGLGGWGKGRGL